MRLLGALFISMSLMTGTVMAKSETIIYGYVEKITLVDKNLILPAKLDTGAKSASLNAIDIQTINVEGEPYLRFTVPMETGNVTFESKYVGKVKIKIRDHENLIQPESTFIKRPVILLNIKLGDQTVAIPVNLTNRKRFLYPLLLGRDAIIKLHGAVNPELTFTVKSKSSQIQ
ncbi:MAG: ATP-dependent zinc protease [Legionella sp.]|nr:ATP-dependent zinc protease [Legionella sp.]